MPITEMLSMNAQIYPNKTSLIERDPALGLRREITWSEFDNMSNRLANALISHGIEKSDKVAILMMNCLEWLPIYFGILKTGALAIPLNFRFTGPEIKKCLETAGAKILIFGPEFEDRIRGIAGKAKCLEHAFYVGDGQPSGMDGIANFFDIIRDVPTDAPGIDISDDQEAALYFTSGTTGTPKPIVLTHSNLVSACITENHHHLQTHEDNFLCIPPLYHTGAKMHWFGSLMVGSKAVILKGVKPEYILDAISEEQATIVWLLVPWAQDILEAIESNQVDLDDFKLDQWRLMHIGAQPVPPSLIKRWRRHFPNQSYDTNYGLSESTGPGCVHLGIENIHKVGAIGRPGFNWQAKIVDKSGNALSYGQTGELLVKGPGVMKGYFNNEAETDKVLRDGWLHTGDMARQDSEGFIYLVDRKKDIIISGGENIFPVEIEDFLQEHHDIKDAAVIGMADERLGEIPVAIIEPKSGRRLGEAAILDFCRSLPRYKRPRKVIFDKVPRNPTGKIEKPVLREKWCGKPSGVLV
ncbi:MAG TPA: class I adenylate-forming enzyme family protein [Clostridia bacterium]|nr:class I adenylate-forming enzyme family protein [Clostridia bacterium]